MLGERGSFRRKLFGGFDRNDVINYIETIAGQRNKYQTEAQQLAQEASEFRGKLDSMTNQLQDRDSRIAETSKDLDSARKELDTARKELDDVWKELRATMDELEVIKGQLDRSIKELAAKSNQYENDLAAAQTALNDATDAKNRSEEQRVAAITNASQIVTELRSKFEDTKTGVDSLAGDFRRELDTVSNNMSAISSSFTDAEAQLEKLLANND